jgi:bacterioferritin
VPEQLKSDLEVEYRAVKRLNDGIKLCREKGDHASEELSARSSSPRRSTSTGSRRRSASSSSSAEVAYLAEQI